MIDTGYLGLLTGSILGSRVSGGASAHRTAHWSAKREDPANPGHRLSADEPALVEDPWTGDVEFLERVVRQHGGVDLLGHLEDECIAATDCACWWRDEFSGEECCFVLGPLGLIDAIGEGGIDDHGDGVDLMFLHEGGNRVVELTQAGGCAALGGDVGAIDDHMGSDHGDERSFRLGECRRQFRSEAGRSLRAPRHRTLEWVEWEWPLMQGGSIPL